LIFVTVGGMRGFERLICQMDVIAGELVEKVIMQIGFTIYEPTNCEWTRFMSRTDIEQAFSDARLIVAHAGTGSILTALEHNKPLVLVPRLKKHGEAFDDHQLEIGRKMESRGIKVVYDTGDLRSALKDNDIKPIEVPGEPALVRMLKDYLDGLEE